MIKAIKQAISAKIRRSVFAVLEQAEIGTLDVTTPAGERLLFGKSGMGRTANIRIHDWMMLLPLATKGDIGFAETYIDGQWDTDSLEDLIAFFLDNSAQFDRYSHGGFLQRIGFYMLNNIVRRNSRSGSKSNIQSHYDVGNEFYKLWLDKSMTYSSALYADADTKLEDAQHAKYKRILNRLEANHQEILEIGCGWGGFAEAAASEGNSVTGVTVSPAQYEFATQRLRDKQLDKAVVKLQDYRDIKGKFGGIVSIEMFEAVGERYWPDYFKTIKDRLAEGGKAIIQTITIDDRIFEDYKKRSDFIRHYIFPGGMLPAVSRFMDEAKKAGLACSEPFSFGKDYARTLREWLGRFEAALPEIRKMGHDEAFQRSWRFYLAMCAAAFSVERTNVVQFELAHAA